RGRRPADRLAAALGIVRDLHAVGLIAAATKIRVPLLAVVERDVAGKHQSAAGKGPAGGGAERFPGLRPGAFVGIGRYKHRPDAVVGHAVADGQPAPWNFVVGVLGAIRAHLWKTPRNLVTPGKNDRVIRAARKFQRAGDLLHGGKPGWDGVRHGRALRYVT